jgi:hypothetical protein
VPCGSCRERAKARREARAARVAEYERKQAEKRAAEAAKQEQTKQQEG